VPCGSLLRVSPLEPANGCPGWHFYAFPGSWRLLPSTTCERRLPRCVISWRYVWLAATLFVQALQTIQMQAGAKIAQVSP
jgi:hypothetical protein